MSKKWFIKDDGQVCFKSDSAELNGWDTQSLVDCLNGKEIKIADLQSQLAITEKALELASETIKQMCGKPLWIGGNIPSPEPKDSKYFKDIAKEMLENE